MFDKISAPVKIKKASLAKPFAFNCMATFAIMWIFL